jgi:hypothetical protein
MAKLLVEIDLGDDQTIEELVAHIEANKEDYFPVGENFISVDSAQLRADPNDDDFYLFKLKGIFDEESGPEK